MGAAVIDGVPSGDLRQVQNGSPEVSGEEELSATEIRRRNANDRVGVLVDLNDVPHYCPVGVEAGSPAVIAQDDVGRAVLAMFISRMEKPAEIRLNAECIEIVAAHQVRPQHPRSTASC